MSHGPRALRSVNRKRVAQLLLICCIVSVRSPLATGKTAYPETALAPYDGQHIYPALPHEGGSLGTAYSYAEGRASRISGEVGATATASSFVHWGCIQPGSPATAQVTEGCQAVEDQATTPTSTSVPGGVVVTTPLGATGPAVGIGASSALAYGEVGHTITGIPQGSHTVTISFTELRTDREASPAGRDAIDVLAWSATQVDAIVEYYPCMKGCAYSFVQRISLNMDDNLSGATIDLASRSFTASVNGGRVYVRAGLVSRAVARGAFAVSSASCTGKVASITVT